MTSVARQLFQIMKQRKTENLPLLPAKGLFLFPYIVGAGVCAYPVFQEMGMMWMCWRERIFLLLLWHLHILYPEAVHILCLPCCSASRSHLSRYIMSSALQDSWTFTGDIRFAFFWSEAYKLHHQLLGEGMQYICSSKLRKICIYLSFLFTEGRITSLLLMKSDESDKYLFPLKW